jgi:hypothetical protein
MSTRTYNRFMTVASIVMIGGPVVALVAVIAKLIS